MCTFQKNAGSSIRAIYEEMKTCTIKMNIKNTIHGNLQTIPKGYKTSFCVIRDPYEWFFSIWVFTKYKNTKKTWKALRPIRSYEQFIMNDGDKIIKKNLGLSTQIDWTVGVPFENILLFENIEEELKNLFERNNIESYRELQKKNTNSIKKNYNDQKIISKEAKSKLDVILAKDIELYEKVKGTRK